MSPFAKMFPLLLSSFGDLRKIAFSRQKISMKLAVFEYFDWLITTVETYEASHDRKESMSLSPPVAYTIRLLKTERGFQFMIDSR